MKIPLLYHIDEEICINCGSCRRFCPVDTISYVNLQHQVEMDGCIGCTICYAVCPVDAVKITSSGPGEPPRLLDTETLERVRKQAWARGPFYQQTRRLHGQVPHKRNPLEE